MRKYSHPLKRKGGFAWCYDRQKAEIRCARSKDLSSSKSASGCTEKDEENAAGRDRRMKLYQSFIVPHFNYCAETWNFYSKGATTKLEKLNERALRFVYRDYSSSYEMLLKQSGYQTLLNQRLAKILTTVYKVVNRQGVSESLCDLVELRESNYNLRGDKILTLPKVNTTKYGLKSLRYEGANLWNKLPNEYRKADSYKLFKKQISDTDLAGRYMS